LHFSHVLAQILVAQGFQRIQSVFIVYIVVYTKPRKPNAGKRFRQKNVDNSLHSGAVQLSIFVADI
jgi:hypothetical protein